MNPIVQCNVPSGQHCWVILPKGKGLESYSCPMCGQLVYWSETLKQWVKPATSGGTRIKGNNQPKERMPMNK